MKAISIFDDIACEPRVEYRGKIDDEIRYYLDLAGYGLNLPLLDGSDIAFLKFFVLTLLVRRYLAKVWGDPMGEVVAMLEEDYRRTPIAAWRYVLVRKSRLPRFGATVAAMRLSSVWMWLIAVNCWSNVSDRP